MNVLFVCTGNSARSQMAEGLARHMRLWDDVGSAGTSPKGVNPHAIAVMAEIGIDISSHTSKQLSAELIDRADVFITLCGDARDNCPLPPKGKKHLHWGFVDPAAAEGGEQEVRVLFRQVRDQIAAALRERAHEVSS